MDAAEVAAVSPETELGRAPAMILLIAETPDRGAPLIEASDRRDRLREEVIPFHDCSLRMRGWPGSADDRAGNLGMGLEREDLFFVPVSRLSVAVGNTRKNRQHRAVRRCRMLLTRSL
jgi:hypothetical protein